MNQAATDESARAADEMRNLVERCRAGDQAAMLELVEQFQGRVFGLCFRMLGQRQDAEDVAQEAFVRALRSLATWDADRAFQPWLMAIAANRCRTLLALRGRRPQAGGDLHHHAERPSGQPEAADLAEEIERALENIREEYRQAFLLFHQHELSYAEIAAALNCPLGTVKTWVHRARRELAEQLQDREVVEACRHELRRV